ncbi:MAG: sulfatase-like hydrolase/transferase, partial [Planctomycetales bacterium]|nr:sulfatase-like hydrolase/transferase [Planctomycetales bacterium]
PWRDGKQSMYEGGLRVPACAVWPGRIAPGGETDAVGLTMDLFPTVCEAAGAKFEHAIDGVSLLDVFEGRASSTPPRDLFFHRREGGVQYGGLIINAVRRGPWKLLQNSPFAPQELYNLADDPGERHDLAAENTGKFRELAAALRVQVQRGGAVPWQPIERREASGGR